MWTIIVVGAGPAGLACAITAADAGARVLLLEKATDVGGALPYSGGHLCAGGFALQRDRGIADDLVAACGRRRGVHSGADLAGLAGRAGIDADGLRATVARYNDAVALGHDPDFGRTHLPAPLAEPPFYAIENHPVTLITFAGVDVDTGLRVRRADGRTIPGLFAIGEVIGSAAVNGNAFCSGMCLTPALAFGRLLARDLTTST